MKQLSIFVDESGDFGEYAKHSPFYIINYFLYFCNHENNDARKPKVREVATMA